MKKINPALVKGDDPGRWVGVLERIEEDPFDFLKDDDTTLRTTIAQCVDAAKDLRASIEAALKEAIREQEEKNVIEIKKVLIGTKPTSPDVKDKWFKGKTVVKQDRKAVPWPKD